VPLMHACAKGARERRGYLRPFRILIFTLILVCKPGPAPWPAPALSEPGWTGQSIGCVPALALAAQGIGTRNILVSPFTSVPRMATSAYPFLAPVSWLLPWIVRDPCDNSATARRVRRPTLVIHGTQDEIVPFQHGQAPIPTVPALDPRRMLSGRRFMGF
jgi:pimeloyl-ACP methyl ester carboxylesterase